MSTPRPQPKMMVIGDSLAQGCRSLSVKREYCAQSWPARVAQAQGWEFVAPDFAREILFDLEKEIRRLDTLSLSVNQLRFQGFEGRVRQNLGEWLINAVESEFPCFDNIALSGAEIHDLYTRTAGTSAAEIADLTPQGADTPVPLGQIGNLHIAINGRFTLNPAQDPAFAGFTPLDWVRERKPELLIVQIGHNHGLYAVGSQAKVVPIDQGDAANGTFWDQWARVANELARLPAEVATLLVCLMPKVGAVADLKPHGTARTNGYADSYEAVFSPSIGVLSGDALAGVDASIRTMNDRIKKTVTDAATAAGTVGRVKFLDLYVLFEKYDFKNSLDATRQVAVGNGVTIDNRYVNSAVSLAGLFHGFGRRLIAGGFESADGMHPSGAGYALLAAEAMTLLELANNQADLVRQGFAEDPLLSSPAVELDILASLLQALRDLERSNHFLVGQQTFLTNDLHLTDAIRFMRQVFVR